jgi:hypothetical protein
VVLGPGEGRAYMGRPSSDVTEAAGVGRAGLLIHLSYT